MSAAPQLRAIFRLQLFALGSWVVVASGLPAVLTPFPKRWQKTAPDGTGLLPFQTGVFQAAIDVGAPVVPVGIRYLSLDGKPLDAEAHKLVGWFQGEPFLRHLLRLGGHRQVRVGIKFGAPLLSPREDWRQLAARAEEAVFGLLGIPPGTRPNWGRRKEARASE